MKKHYIIMGVSGCGKSTIGALLAKNLNVPFFDGDDFHPESNIIKMSSGSPLYDNDRKPWLEILSRLPLQHPSGCVITCSALKKSYRDILRSHCSPSFIHLIGSKEILLERLENRTKASDHFMPLSLLSSQLETLETPKDESDCQSISITHSIQTILSLIKPQPS